MNRRWRKLVPEHDLGAVETEYVRLAHATTRGLGQRDRRVIVDGLVEHLSERPAAGSLDELIVRLGGPSTYVDVASRREGLNKGTPFTRWMQRPVWVRFAQMSVVLALVTGALAFRAWYVAVPEFVNGCGGVAASEVEVRTAASTTEYRVTFRQDERLGVMVCPWTRTKGVTIERVYRPVLSRRAFQPVGTEVNLTRLGVAWVGDASLSVSYRSEDVPWGAEVILWYEMEYCNISGRIGFDDFLIDYRYRGRMRTASVPLRYHVSVGAGDQCTDAVRAVWEAESAAWASVVYPRLSSYGNVHEVGPLGLAPEGVSADLCRYLSGVIPITGFDGTSAYAEFEPLSERAVFHLGAALAELLIDGAVLGICPEFADRRDELVALVQPI